MDSLSWKAAAQGLYLMQINIKYIEKVVVLKPNQEDNDTDKTNELIEEKDKVLEAENEDVSSINEVDAKDEDANADEPKEEIQYKEVEKEIKINKLIMVGDPFKYVGPSATSINSLVVGNVGEGERIYIKAQPNSNSKNIGYIYGSLQGVKILKQVGKFYYIEATEYDSLKVVKGYVYTWQLKTVKPTGAYSIIVDLSDQRVYVFKDKQLLKTIICSTGEDETPTPIGTYLVGYRGSHFYTGYKNSVICYNWVRFNNNFLFHSVLFNTKGEIYQWEADRLGTKASHGCIRLPLEDSKWIYDNILRGSLGIVQN
jgi:lipoprotein-anchoring transpeptidase ErfK/SrfK